MGITIKDIARKAGVSIATVSRYLNNPKIVSQEKQILLAEIIAESDFQPNELARGLITNSSNTLGIILPDINNIFYPAVLRGIEDKLEESGYNAFVCNTDYNMEKEKNYINALLSKKVAGIIFIGTRPTGIQNNQHLIELNEKLPIVMINDYIIGHDIHCVMTDEVEGAYKAVSYLIGLGHKKIAFLNSYEEQTTYQYKQMGYERALADYSIPLRPAYSVKDSTYESGGYNGMCKLLKLDDMPTAILTAHDMMAIGVIRAAYERGYKIPDDFSLIGYSNSPISAEVYPRITTVDQFPYKTGAMAADKIINLIKRVPESQNKITLKTELLIRDTCRSIA